jgi:hypothetical protein
LDGLTLGDQTLHDSANRDPSEEDSAGNDPLNYFNYFSEIEGQYLRRRGGGLLLSTLDWVLIETWKDAGIPLEAALRGIDAAFDRYDLRASKTKKVNSLAYCSQEVLAAAEDMKEAAVGAAGNLGAVKTGAGQGFEAERIGEFLRRNGEILDSAKLPSTAGISGEAVARECGVTLRKIASEVESKKSALKLEDIERHLTVLEEKLFAALLAATPDEDVVCVRAQADRELSPYRSKMGAPQVDQLRKQYIHKRLLEKYGIPRLSLFYM